jgi:NADH:ubiquinone oxidoreductase subunit F (NADH-binding)/(2Fe-2S) ferredoxin/Pyruvate/2-oxoacid:ferredoxin oxidoreductase delta subunit
MASRSNAMICTCTNCISNGALTIRNALDAEIEKQGLSDDIEVVQTGASGLCVRGPILMVQPEGIFYQHLQVADIPNLVEEHFLKGRPVESLMYTPDEESATPIPKMRDIPFFKDQRLIALRNRGIIDPDSIDEYIANDGYKALSKALVSMTPDEVIAEILAAGLRGRGGAGFPTGKKWEMCRANVLKTREDDPDRACYLICNADEGDPGAFMDRSIIEADPHSIIEAMTIAAYAMGATQGYIYLRIEYPLAIKRITEAIKTAREYGLLGEDILGKGFNFDIKTFEGAGAFVCGEETSLIRSIEGLAPEPKQKPPFPAQSGLWGCPTNINNVETFANIPMIINWGSKWFSAIGTETSCGTKVFSLAGNITNAGLVEVPMGITLREMVYEIGGGIPDGKKLKAIQSGGPSGGFIPERLLHLQIDYEKLKEAGAIMGSGGLIVMDEDTCIVDIAKYFIEFTNDESCGKCSSCREGATALHGILERICNGEGKEEDLILLDELGSAVKEASMCGLGQTLPNPVLTALRYFREEFETHIREKKCPAKVCKALITFGIDAEKCTGCTLCAKNCPVTAITGVRKETHVIDQDKCIKCGVCKQVCKFEAVTVK